MGDDFETTLGRPIWVRVGVRWLNFCEQWRNSYLLLLVVFLMVAWGASRAVPVLYEKRVMGGLHPMDVHMLMTVLGVMWLPPCMIVVLYGLSFMIRALNTVEAIAGTALVASVVLGFALMVALFRMSLLW